MTAKPRFAIGFGLATLALLLAACSLLPATGSKGTMPPPGANGKVDPAAVPDFVAVAGPISTVGYVAKEAVLNPVEVSWPVYAEDLRTVVGHLEPGRGFVPAGVDPNTVPTIPVEVGAGDPNATPREGIVLAYVRNRGAADVWIAVIHEGQVQPGGGGFPGAGYIGVWCDPVPVGSRLVSLDKSPTNVAVAPHLVIYVGGTVTGTVSRWLDIAKDGSATIGNGVPSWWTGGPPPC
jgi:hypothetical protein